jgi:RNA polymerase sigma factor (sigma-70 family)
MDPHDEAVPQPGVGDDGLDFPALYEKHKDAMYGMARKMLRGDDQHRAEDVVQDAVFSVWRNPPETVQNWQALFVQAVKWKIYDLWKSAAHKHERLVLEEASLLDRELGGDDLDLDPGLVVEETLERAAVIKRIRGALAELSRTDSEAAHVYWQVKGVGRTSGEVAEEMGVSASRVRQHVKRAREKLIEILSASGGGL